MRLLDQRSWARLGRYTSLGFLLPVSTLVGYIIGYLLDRLFGTSFLYIVFLALGTVAGFVSLLREIKRLADEDGP